MANFLAHKTLNRRRREAVPLNTKMIAGGVAHKMPADLQKAILSNSKMLAVWEDITPLARNEWICWILSAKKKETRERRIEVGRSKLASGMRRPCCWAGCVHRSK